MKKYILILIAQVLTSNAFSQSPDWGWAKSGAGTGNDYGNAIAKDANGGIYVTGKFVSPTITFGSTILTNNGNSDIFIVKYSSSGDVIWAKNFGGAMDESAASISIDANDNLYITGYFFSTSIAFGGFTVNEVVPNYSADLFIVKLNSSGNVLWAKSAGGVWDDSASGVTTDLNGNVYITGGFEGPVMSFGSFTLTGGGQGHSKFFIVKYDAAGNAQWGKTAGGTSTDEGSGITTDPSGNIIVTGYYHSPSITFGNTTLNNLGFYNSFITKYDNLGNVIWAKSVGGTGDDKAFKVCSDSNSNIYVIGAFYSQTGVFGNTTLTNASSTGNTGDLFVMKYDSSGTPLWSKSAGNTSNDYGINLNTDVSGNLFVIGWFSSTTITFGSTTLTKSGTDDIFIVKYDTLGNIIWAKNAGCNNSVGNNYMDGNDIVINAQGEVYITGSFYCDTITLGSNILTNASTNYGPDILTAKLNSSLGTNEISLTEKIIIYPNPFETKTSIDFEEEQENLNVKIIDVLGNEIKTMNFTGKQLTIEKGQMQSGIYFIQLIDEKKNVVTKKIIVQ